MSQKKLPPKFPAASLVALYDEIRADVREECAQAAMAQVLAELGATGDEDDLIPADNVEFARRVGAAIRGLA